MKKDDVNIERTDSIEDADVVLDASEYFYSRLEEAGGIGDRKHRWENLGRLSKLQKRLIFTCMDIIYGYRDVVKAYENMGKLRSVQLSEVYPPWVVTPMAFEEEFLKEMRRREMTYAKAWKNYIKSLSDEEFEEYKRLHDSSHCMPNLYEVARNFVARRKR